MKQKTPFIMLIILLTTLIKLSVYAEEKLIEIGVDEKIGSTLPLNITITDEFNHSKPLKDFLDKPTIMHLVFYQCSGMCGPMTGNIIKAVEKVNLMPGKEYQILSISFNESETTEIAQESKKLYLGKMEKPFPENAWHFTVTDSNSIKDLTESVGFKYKKEGTCFKHPGILIIVSPDGEIVRYLYGLTFLSKDIELALTEASPDNFHSISKKLMLSLYSFDTVNKTYSLKYSIIITLAVFVLIVLLLFYGFITSRKQQ